MDLWIRSQNKTELMRVVDLDIYDAGKPKTYVIESRGIILGNYKTQQRALEVLDEIHQRLINLGTLEIAPDSYKILPKDTSNVYKMPKE